MALEQHPNVFRFEGRLWVSELPREQMHERFAAQRAWDAAHVKSEHWTAALVVGAIVGTAATLGLGTTAGIAPALYLVLLPIGFGFGVVLGALANKKILGRAEVAPATTPRPELGEVIRVPAGVARKADDLTPVSDLIEWSRAGYAPRS